MTLGSPRTCHKGEKDSYGGARERGGRPQGHQLLLPLESVQALPLRDGGSEERGGGDRLPLPPDSLQHIPLAPDGAHPHLLLEEGGLRARVKRESHYFEMSPEETPAVGPRRIRGVLEESEDYCF
eukprot:CAMPEP_0168617788 /NCGR_PEP_ID=MMETSP0449_2-20121227/5727_1 /TAXON_ID=1082188 /ORGANISM="Strombidium rassoulzadegani, Strain ras09" /LENGTH=124 /DNA_ID=CAMNT_0008658623 /DNA_START=33 /DNA_END=407 /DNA_ORIENTATION=-